jgi:hypothetical protein
MLLVDVNLTHGKLLFVEVVPSKTGKPLLMTDTLPL